MADPSVVTALAALGGVALGSAGSFYESRVQRHYRWDETRRAVYLSFLKECTNYVDEYRLAREATSAKSSPQDQHGWAEVREALKGRDREVRLLAGRDVSDAAGLVTHLLVAMHQLDEHELPWASTRVCHAQQKYIEGFIGAVRQELGLQREHVFGQPWSAAEDLPPAPSKGG